MFYKKIKTSYGNFVLQKRNREELIFIALYIIMQFNCFMFFIFFMYDIFSIDFKGAFISLCFLCFGIGIFLIGYTMKHKNNI